MITTKEFRDDPRKHGFITNCDDSPGCWLCGKPQSIHTGDPADDGYEVLVIRRERQITAEEAQS